MSLHEQGKISAYLKSERLSPPEIRKIWVCLKKERYESTLSRKDMSLPEVGKIWVSPEDERFDSTWSKKSMSITEVGKKWIYLKPILTRFSLKTEL